MAKKVWRTKVQMPYGVFMITLTDHKDLLSIAPYPSHNGNDQEIMNPDQLPNELIDPIVTALRDLTGVPPSYHISPRQYIWAPNLWQELQKIPRGTTISYSELAKRLHLPHTYSRALGQALHHNSIACLVPCHRVVSSSGKLGGYRWGVDLKMKILQYEKGLNEESQLYI